MNIIHDIEVSNEPTVRSYTTFLLCRSVSHTLSQRQQKKRRVQWWKVDLGSVQAVNLVVIYNRMDCCVQRLNGALVYAGKEKCGTIRWRKNQHVYFVSCNGAKARFVKVTLAKEYLQLAEVQVFGGAKAVKGLGLLSLNKPTSQSSTGWGGKSSRAVDGNPNGHYGRRTSTHTRTPKNSWWQVNLQKAHPIHLVIIHNRVDCCHNRIDGAKVGTITAVIP